MAVLSDQIESATDKITDMEKLLDDKKEVLRKTEELLQVSDRSPSSGHKKPIKTWRSFLQREILTRSSLETQKLELMSQVTNLKLRQASVDQENVDLRKRLAKTLDLSSVATAALAAATSGQGGQQNGSQAKPLAAAGQGGGPPAGQRLVLQTSEAMLRKNLEYNQKAVASSNQIQGFGTLPKKKKSRERVLETHFDEPKVIAHSFKIVPP